jgi:hypothetical protein
MVKQRTLKIQSSNLYTPKKYLLILPPRARSHIKKQIAIVCAQIHRPVSPCLASDPRAPHTNQVPSRARVLPGLFFITQTRITFNYPTPRGLFTACPGLEKEMEGVSSCMVGQSQLTCIHGLHIDLSTNTFVGLI